MTEDMKSAVLERASHRAKGVSKLMAVRVKQETWEALKAQADLAGVKVCDIVRALSEEFCS